MTTTNIRMPKSGKKTKKNEKSNRPLQHFFATVDVTLKKSVLDPQGQTILQALHSLGFKKTASVRVGKFFEMSLQARDEREAEAQVKSMSEQLLTNPVIEQYSFEIKKAKNK